MGRQEVSVRGPQLGADGEVVACCIQAPPVLFGDYSSGWRWKYLPLGDLEVAWCSGNSEGFRVRPRFDS